MARKQDPIRTQSARKGDVSGRNILLIRARFNAGLTQKQLAERAEVSERTIQNLEGGSRPEAPTAKAVADVFELRPTDLFQVEADWDGRERRGGSAA